MIIHSSMPLLSTDSLITSYSYSVVLDLHDPRALYPCLLVSHLSPLVSHKLSSGV